MRNLIEAGSRGDGRELDEFRPTIINKDSISTAEGSSLVKIGSTTVVCGIKAVSNKMMEMLALLSNRIFFRS